MRPRRPNWLIPLIAGTMILLLALANLPQAEGMSTRWEGTTDNTMLEQARKDLDTAKAADAYILKVTISSYGGPVTSGLEIERLVREARNSGLIVEFHATAECASMCTIILASGSPGHRYIQKQILFLVHSIQMNNECVKFVDNPTDVDDKVGNVQLTQIRASYMLNTGQPEGTVQYWTTCGNELVGGGDLAVVMKIADQTE